MRSFIAATALLHSLATLASAQISNDSSSACPQQGGVHIIVARASLEAEGFGIIGVVKDAVLSRIPGSTAEFVVYPATLTDYTGSESDGVVADRALIDAYINNCPGQPLVAMGYSQGAQVTLDSLVGQYVRNFPENSTIEQPLAESTLARVAAVIVMGDPSFVNNETFHVGNATVNSLFPRENGANFDIADLGSRTQSYCDAGDPYCDAGNMLAVHLRYVQEYGTAATDFVVKNVAAWYSANGGSIGTAPVASATASRSASSRAATGTASRSVPSASASLSSVPASSSATVTPTAASTSASPTSTGGASSLEIAGAGVGAVVAAAFAFIL